VGIKNVKGINKAKIGPECKMLVIARANALQKDDEVVFQNLDGAYLDGIAQGYMSMAIVTSIHRKGRDETYDDFAGYTYRFQSPNVEFVEIPDYKDHRYSFATAFKRLPRQLAIILLQIIRHDVTFAMMSTYRAVFAAIVSRLLGKKVIVYSGNDWRMDAATTYKWKNGIARHFFPFYAFLCGMAEKSAMRAAHIRFLNGESLMKKYHALRGVTMAVKPVVTIKKEDFHERVDTCRKPTIKLLCIASIQPRKGIEYLIRAMPELVIENKEISLDIVGAATQPYADEMVALSRNLGIGERLQFKGYIPQGDLLLSLYRNSDIFILPSLSEGFPRVLYEAMSQSLPIIVSKIENVYNRLGDTGLVLYSEPASSVSIKEMTLKLINNGEIRKIMIKKSFDYVQNTLNLTPAQQFKEVVLLK